MAAAGDDVDARGAAGTTTAAPPPKNVFVQVIGTDALTEGERAAIEDAVATGAASAGSFVIERATVTVVEPTLVTDEATEALTRGDRSAADGHERVRNFDFEGALDLLDWAAEEYSKNLVALMVRDGNASRLVEVYVQTAIVHFLSGDEEQAARALRQAFVIEPTLQYTTERFPPQLEDFVLEQRFAFDESGTGVLAITAATGAPRVFVNGIERGTAPIEVHDVHPGINFVTFLMPGGGRETITVEVDGAQTVDVHTELAPAPGPAGPLDGARAEIGGERAGELLGAAASTLGVQALLVVVPEPGDAVIRLRAYVYDMRTGTLSGRAETEVPRDDPAPEAEELGRRVLTTTQWELHVAIAAPSLWDRTKGVARRAYEWPYFWHAVGATAGVLVITTIAIAADGGLSPGKTVSILPVIDF